MRQNGRARMFTSKAAGGLDFLTKPLRLPAVLPVGHGLEKAQPFNIRPKYIIRDLL